MRKFLKSKLLKSTVVAGTVCRSKNGVWDPKSFLFMPKHPAVKLSWEVESVLKRYYFLPYEYYHELVITVKFADHQLFGMPCYHDTTYRLQVEQVDGLFIPIHAGLWNQIREDIRLKQAYYFDDLVEYELDSCAGYPQDLIFEMDRVSNTYPPSFTSHQD